MATDSKRFGIECRTTFFAAKRAMERLKDSRIEKVDKDNHLITGKIDVTAFSWGHGVRIQVLPDGSGSIVKVKLKKKRLTNLFSKPDRTVSDFFKLIGDEL